MDLELWKQWKALPETSPKKRVLLNKLIIQNQSLSKKFVDRILRFTTVHIDPDDAYQAGLIGMMSAFKRYDPNRLTKFSTMAWYWVRYEVQNELAKQLQIHRPRSAGMPFKAFHAAEIIETIFGREATAEDLGVSDTEFRRWQALAYRCVPIDEVQDTKDGDDSAASAFRDADNLTDKSATADEELASSEFDAKMAEILDEMTEAEKRVIINGENFGGKANALMIRTSFLERVKEQIREYI